MSVLDDQNILQEELDNTISDNYYTPTNSFLGNICVDNMIGMNKYNNLMIFKDCHWVIDEVLSGECLKILIDAGATLNDLQNDNIKNYIEEYKESVIKAINVHNYSIYCTALSIHKEPGLKLDKDNDWNNWIGTSKIYCDSNNTLNATLKASNADTCVSIGKSQS